MQYSLEDAHDGSWAARLAEGCTEPSESSDE